MGHGHMAHAASLLWATLAVSPAALAVGLANGDFATGDFTGWTLDTDGSPGSPPDFEVVGSPGAFAAALRADYWSTPGDLSSTPLTSVFIANTLAQELDTALSPGARMRLTFDWLFEGEDGGAGSGDSFSAYLNDGLGQFYGADGLLGFLVEPTSLYGSGTFSAVLDTAAFANRSGWFLDVALGVGVDAANQPNGLGSTLRIANVALTEFIPAPAPAPLALLALGLPLLARRASGPRAGHRSR